MKAPQLLSLAGLVAVVVVVLLVLEERGCRADTARRGTARRETKLMATAVRISLSLAVDPQAMGSGESIRLESDQLYALIQRPDQGPPVMLDGDLSVSADGHIFDPWGKSYIGRVSVVGGEVSVVVWSCGPNGKDDGSQGDDVAFRMSFPLDEMR